MNRITRHFAVLVVIAVGLGLASPASAAFKITLDDGINPVVTIEDNMVGDTNLTAGILDISETLGVWTLIGSLNFSNSAIFPEPPSFLNTDVSAASTGAGTLTVEITNTGFSTIGNADVQYSTTDVLGSATVLFDSYWDAGNGEFAKTTSFGSFGPVGSPNSASTSGPVSSSPYSLTATYLISAPGASIINPDITIEVNPIPEPAMLTLFGMGLMGVGTVIRRKRHASGSKNP